MHGRAVLGLAVVAACLFAPIVALPAGDTVVQVKGVDILMPASSPVSKPVAAPGDDISIHFQGKFVLAGIFHDGGDGITFLVPDRDIAARLPHRKDDGRPREIWFDNADTALAAIVPKPARPNSTASGADRHVVLDVDTFTINIECDVSTYYVHFIAVHGPGAMAKNVTPEEGC